MISSELMQLDGTIVRMDRNQVHLALALADTGMLKSLLVDCSPAIALPHQIGQLRVTVGSPLDVSGGHPIDAVLAYEHLWCAPAEGAPTDDAFSVKDYQSLTRCQSELKTLGWRINLSEAIALLRHGGFEEEQIQRILQLPWEGWHRSWWDTLEAKGTLGLPFQRWFRTRCYSDGTYTLQYRDHYHQDAPPCFRGIWQQAPVMVRAASSEFGTTLAALRQARHKLKAERCILLADELSDLEAEGYIRQGVSLYSLAQSPLTEQSLCHHCDHVQCPMSDRRDAPVVSCKAYIPQP